ncbi:hypothetical protein D5086_015335 [Populus alba]|uniref:Uncharacterized protein n=1 Tax=Populus alba TaxID=43335 RepID=A0ACC4C1I9_POPAL
MRSTIYPSIIYNKAFGVCRARRKVCLADALPRLNSDISPTPGHHSTVIIVVFVSLGGLFFLAFLSVALCCFIKKKKKKTVQKTEILEFDEHTKVHEAIVPGPHGEKITVLNIEEDVHLVEEIKKNEKLTEGSHIKSALDHPLGSDIATPSSQYNQQHLEHKV